jgi:hypothetical protein
MDRAVFLLNGRMVTDGLGGQQVMIGIDDKKGEEKRELRVR